MPKNYKRKPMEPCRWCGLPIEQEPGQSGESHSQMIVHKGECRTKHRSMRAKERRAKAKEARLSKAARNADLTDYVQQSKVEEDAGVSPGKLTCWLRRRNKLRHPYRITFPHCNYVRVDVADEYLSRYQHIPKGWVTLKRVQMDTPVLVRHWMEKLAEAGTIEPRRRHPSIYLSPEDAALVRQTALSKSAPPSWVAVQDVAKRAGCKDNSLIAWLGNHPEVEVREYRLGNRMGYYIRHKDADYYINEVGNHYNSRRRQPVLLEAA